MFRQLSIGMVAALLLCSTAWAQEGGLRADLVKDWAAQKERLVALAQAMPAEKYEFKATPEQRSFGEQMHHLGQANLNLFKRLDPQGKVPAPAAPTGHGRDEVVKFLGESYDYAAAVLAAVPDAALTAPGTQGRTPARTVWAAMSNAANHYGQCVVYLRLNGIVPPASRR